MRYSSAAGEAPYVNEALRLGEDVRLFHGDALDVLPTLAERADAIVTSPPYADARDDVESVTPGEFVEWISPFLVALLGCVVPGGAFLLNLGRRFKDGVESDYVERVLLRAQEVGWSRVDTVVWVKINGRAVNPYLTNKHESILWLTPGTWSGPRKAFECLSEADARWLALFLDTEGNIQIGRSLNRGNVQYQVRAVFSNSSRDLIDHARSMIGVGAIQMRSDPSRDPKYAPMFDLTLTNKNAHDLLLRLHPHLIVKQRQARVAIHAQAEMMRPQKRPGGRRTDIHSALLDRSHEAIKTLNQRGEIDLSWVPDPQYGSWGGDPLRAFRGYAEVRYPYPEESLLRYQRNWVNGTTVKGEREVQAGRAAHPDGARPGSVYVTQVGKEKGIRHPTPMALDLARFLVCVGSPPRVCEFCGPLARAGGNGLLPNGKLCNHSRTAWRRAVVLDPFFGAGTTGVAARLHDRECVGVERDAEHVAEACERLAQLALAEL